MKVEIQLPGQVEDDGDRDDSDGRVREADLLQVSLVPLVRLLPENFEEDFTVNQKL